MRYVYLGDAMTDPALVGQECDPMRRADGRCIVSRRMATQLVRFADGVQRVVKRRRLRVVECGDDTHFWPQTTAEKQAPYAGESCRCGLMQWSTDGKHTRVHYPAPAPAEERAALLADIMATEVPADFDPNDTDWFD